MRERPGAVLRAARVHGRHGQQVRRRVEREGDVRVVDRDVERDVRAAGSSALAVVHVPALVDRHLRVVGAGVERGRLERVTAVAVGVLEPRAEAVRLPVGRAAELGLEVAHGDRDHGAVVVRDPVALVVVVELDARVGSERERDVRPAGLRVQPVVLVPRVVQRSLVVVAPGRDKERALPDVVGGVVREMRRGAGWIPVARTPELRLQRAGDRDRGRVRRVRRRGRDQGQPERGEREQQQATRARPTPAPRPVLLHPAEAYDRRAGVTSACGRSAERRLIASHC